MALVKILGIFLVFGVLFGVLAEAETLEFAIVGDGGRRNTNLTAVKASILKTSVRKLILPGDNLYESSYNSVWDHWYQADPDKAVEFSVVAIGNHTGGYEQEMEYFSKVNPSLFPNKKDHYAITYKDSVVFFVLNSDNKQNISQQMEWLDRQLKQTNALFVFLVAHHPTYNVTNHHSWGEVREFNEKFRKVLDRYKSKITALIVGHDHVAALHKFDSIPVILSGATQEARATSSVLRNYRYEDSKRSVSVEHIWSFSNQIPYWARLTLDTDHPELSTVQFVGAPPWVQSPSKIAHAKIDEPVFRLFNLELFTKFDRPSRVPAQAVSRGSGR